MHFIYRLTNKKKSHSFFISSNHTKSLAACSTSQSLSCCLLLFFNEITLVMSTLTFFMIIHKFSRLICIFHSLSLSFVVPLLSSAVGFRDPVKIAVTKIIAKIIIFVHCVSLGVLEIHTEPHLILLLQF